jgi:S1-C subfamily serine protease
MRPRKPFKPFDYVCPVLAGPESHFATSGQHSVVGTAFAIDENRLITAGHAIRAAIGIGDKPQQFDKPRIPIRRLRSVEIIPDLDLAIGTVESSSIKPLRWNPQDINVLTTVRTVGFPFAIDEEPNTLTFRAYQGYITSIIESFSFIPGRPSCYELSFQCPRGLSGAPLLNANHDVVGVIVASTKHSTEISNFTETEQDAGTGTTAIHEISEVTHYGIALKSQTVLRSSSPLLGGRFSEHLSMNGLLMVD